LPRKSRRFGRFRSQAPDSRKTRVKASEQLKRELTFEQIACIPAPHFEQEIVVTRGHGGFLNLLQLPDTLQKCGTVLGTLQGNANESRQLASRLEGVHQRGIPFEYALFFQPPHTVRCGRIEESKLLRQLGPCNAADFGNSVQHFKVKLIQTIHLIKISFICIYNKYSTCLII
jgi:hypothetical protein